jgi:NAD(P)-dependent dehydrogenase (short-subunit alcohol dehydrogenase family)
MKKTKTWIITGASRGFGLEISKAVLASGDNVVATVRSNPEELAAKLDRNPKLHVVILDINDEAQAIKVAAETVEKFGSIDVLANNAGFGLLGGVEEISDQEARRVYETNVFGLLKVTRAVLPHMRRQRSGHVINFSSVGGLTGSAGWGIYCSTKFAVEGITEALAKELAPLGIFATTIEPGYFRTNFLDGASLLRAEKVIRLHGDGWRHARNRHEGQLQSAGRSGEAGRGHRPPRSFAEATCAPSSGQRHAQALS